MLLNKFATAEDYLFNLEVESLKLLFLSNNLSKFLQKETSQQKCGIRIDEIRQKSLALMEEMKRAVSQKIIEKTDMYFLAFMIFTFVDEKVMVALLKSISGDIIWVSLIKEIFNPNTHAGEKIYLIFEECAKTSKLSPYVYRVAIIILKSDYCGQYPTESHSQYRNDLSDKLQKKFIPIYQNDLASKTEKIIITRKRNRFSSASMWLFGIMASVFFFISLINYIYIWSAL